MASVNLTWNSSSQQFEGTYDGNPATLSHNGTTWVFDSGGSEHSNCLATPSVGDHVDPAGLDYFEGSSSCSLNVSASGGASGDPHLDPLQGKPYTI